MPSPPRETLEAAFCTNKGDMWCPETEGAGNGWGGSCISFLVGGSWASWWGAWVAAHDVHRGEPYGLQRLTIPFAPCTLLLLPRASCSFSVGKMASGELSCLLYRGPVGGGQSRLGEACWTALPLLLPIHNRPTLGRRAVSKGAVWTAEWEASP